MQEVWKDITGYEGYYQISNLGRVRKINRCKNYHIMSHSKNEKGYTRVALCVNHKVRSLRINRLVAKAFIPNPNNLPQVNHINGIKTDNRVENLEWVTDEENRMHAIKNGLMKTIKIALLRNGIEIARYDSIAQAKRENNNRYGDSYHNYKVINEDGIYVIYQWLRF